VEIFELDELLARQAAGDRPYLEFQQSADLSTGLYVLAAGAVDRQGPHTEDEIYVVMAGHGLFRSGDEDAVVGPGTVLFVPAGRPHRFRTITEELRILVAFGPAEGSRGR
jgi:mannose-6-phosphate isomerase-like protein (cupin superfamily)